MRTYLNLSASRLRNIYIVSLGNCLSEMTVIAHKHPLYSKNIDNPIIYFAIHDVRKCTACCPFCPGRVMFANVTNITSIILSILRTVVLSQ